MRPRSHLGPMPHAYASAQVCDGVTPGQARLLLDSATDLAADLGWCEFSVRMHHADQAETFLRFGKDTATAPTGNFAGGRSSSAPSGIAIGAGHGEALLGTISGVSASSLSRAGTSCGPDPAPYGGHISRRRSCCCSG